MNSTKKQKSAALIVLSPTLANTDITWSTIPSQIDRLQKEGAQVIILDLTQNFIQQACTRIVHYLRSNKKSSITKAQGLLGALNRSINRYLNGLTTKETISKTWFSMDNMNKLLDTTETAFGDYIRFKKEEMLHSVLRGTPILWQEELFLVQAEEDKKVVNNDRFKRVLIPVVEHMQKEDVFVYVGMPAAQYRRDVHIYDEVSDKYMFLDPNMVVAAIIAQLPKIVSVTTWSTAKLSKTHEENLRSFMSSRDISFGENFALWQHCLCQEIPDKQFMVFHQTPHTAAVS